MRFTRAAKVAAFPLTALILVALVAARGLPDRPVPLEARAIRARWAIRA